MLFLQKCTVYGIWNVAGKLKTSKSPVPTFCQLLPPECALGLTMDLKVGMKPKVAVYDFGQENLPCEGHDHFLNSESTTTRLLISRKGIRRSVPAEGV